jgi:formate dehydrogenase major subunit
MKLVKKTGPDNALTQAAAGLLGKAIDRRAFLKRAGLAAGGTAVAVGLPTRMMRRASAADAVAADGGTVTRRSVCTHCSVGCGVIAEVENGVWTRQQPDFDSPFNMGGHCAKGASVREHGHGEKRVKYPMKKVGGKWERLSWDQAVNEIGDKLLDIRQRTSADSVYWLGSAKFSNEQAYLYRKFAAMWGTNNVDHQARICHSTTVAGVANTWGYGAMTNSYNDMHVSKAMFFIGSNAAEAHPVAMQHILRGKENGAKLIVVDPRFTRTAAHADQFIRLRPGSDVPLIWGVLWHIFQNGWEDKEYISQRVFGMDEVRQEVAKWTPDVVENATGVPEADVKRAAAPSTPSATTTRAPTASCSWRWATSAWPAAAPTSSAATTTCRARPTSACWPTPCPDTTAWPRAPGSTGAACGTSTSSGSRAASTTRSTTSPASSISPPIPASRTTPRT